MLTSRVDPIVRQGLVQWYVAGYNGALAYDYVRGQVAAPFGTRPDFVGNQLRTTPSGVLGFERPACLTAIGGFTFMWRGQILTNTGIYAGKWQEDGDGIKQWLWQSNCSFSIRDSFNASEYTASAASSFVDGFEHVVVCSVTSSSVQIYVDGVASGSPTVAAGTYLPASASVIGMGFARNAFSETLYTREWRIYDRGLSAAEARALADRAALWQVFPSPRRRFFDVPAPTPPRRFILGTH